MKKDRKQLAWYVICLGLIFTVFPFFNMIINGIYSWHIQQPESIDGGIEILLTLLAAEAAMLFFRPKYKIPAVLAIALLYVLRNQVLSALFADLLYFECILFIGYTFCGRTRMFAGKGKAVYFIAGIFTWGMCAIVLSVLQHGTINELRIMTAVLVFISFAMCKDESYAPASFSLIKRWTQKGFSDADKAVEILVLFFVLFLYAQSNTALWYDSLWYGLRSEYVLMGENSFYENLGLLSFIYYYPKLVELFFLPLSGLRDSSYILGMNVLIWLWMYIVSCEFVIAEAAGNVSAAWKKLVLFIVFSIPAISNKALTAEPDTLGWAFVWCAIMWLYYFSKTKQFEYFALCMIALLMCTGTKETYFLWGGITFLFAVLVYIWDLVRHQLPKYSSRDILSLVGLSIPSVILVFGVHLRTFLLTGYPLYPIMINLWNRMGFQPKPYMKDVQNSIGSTFSISRALKTTYCLIFDANSFSHVIMVWVSSFAAFLLCICLLVPYCRNVIRKNLRWIGLGALFAALIVYFATVTEPQPDGNYFILPILYICVFSLLYVFTYAQSNVIKGVKAVTWMFLVLHMVFALVSHPSWRYGTHVFSPELIATQYGDDQYYASSLSNNGLGEIGHYLEENGRRNKIISSDYDYLVLGKLRGAVDSFHYVDNSFYSSGEPGESYEQFCDYLDYAEIEGFIIAHEDESKIAEYCRQYLKENGYDYYLEDTGASLYIIR